MCTEDEASTFCLPVPPRLPGLRSSSASAAAHEPSACRAQSCFTPRASTISQEDARATHRAGRTHQLHGLVGEAQHVFVSLFLEQPHQCLVQEVPSYARSGPVTRKLRAQRASYWQVTRAQGELPSSYARSGRVTRHLRTRRASYSPVTHAAGELLASYMRGGSVTG